MIRTKTICRFCLFGQAFNVRFALIPAVLFLGMFIFLLKLGLWQLARADEKKEILQSIEQGQQMAPYYLDSLPASMQKRIYHKIKLKGYFVNKKQFLLDNQYHQHRIGYHVITPLKVAGFEKLVLIDRGFVVRNPSRSVLPTLQPVTTLQSITGVIHIPTRHLLRLSTVTDNPGQWPYVIERLDFNEISQSLGAPVWPFVVIMDKGAANQYTYDWTPVVMSPERHLGYAMQWFAMALVLIFMCLALAISRDQEGN